MGQNPVNPRPDLPRQPRSAPSGPSAPSFGQPAGPGYGHAGPQGPAQGPQGPVGARSYPAPGQAPYGPSPYGPPPAAAQAGPGYPYAAAQGQQYAIPANPSPRPPKKKGKGGVIAAVAGALVLVLVVGGAAVMYFINRNTPVSTEPDKATTSVAALQGYLDTLAAGNADKAKLYALNAPENSPLLTNDFVKATVAKSPITEIQVDANKDVGTSAYLSASYKLGGTLVQGNYQLTKVAKIWKLNSVVASVDRPSDWGTLAVTINGTAAPATKLVMFPGVYQLATGTTLLSFDQPTFTVSAPDEYVATLSSSQPALTDAGKKLMVSKAQAWLTQCLAVQDVNPKDCGMNTPLADGATLAPGSMKRTVDGTTPPFSDGTPRVSFDDPKKITLSSFVSVKVTAADTAGYTYSGTTSVTNAVGTIDGENITVVFTE